MSYNFLTRSLATFRHYSPRPVFVFPTLCIALALIAICVEQPVSANTLNVPASYPTIAQALESAQEGDTVQVAAGTYYESGLEITKAIVLIGASAGSTIIDGSQGNGAPILTIYNTDYPSGGHGLPPQPVVQNLTFKHGSASTTTSSANVGGGAMLIYQSSPIIAYCNFESNICRGGAGTSATITESSFTGYADNYAYGSVFGDPFNTQPDSTVTTEYGTPGGLGYGGAIASTSSSPTIEYCDFNGNRVYGGEGGPGGPGNNAAGGAIAFNNQSGFYTPAVKSCTFENDQAFGGDAQPQYSIVVNPSGIVDLNSGSAGGGGIATDGVDLDITDCTFTACEAVNGQRYSGGYSTGYVRGGALYQVAGNITCDDSLFYGNSITDQYQLYANGGAICTETDQTQSTQILPTLNLNNCTITGSAVNGGYETCGVGLDSDYIFLGQYSGTLSSGTLNAENDIIYGDKIIEDEVDTSAVSATGSLTNCDLIPSIAQNLPETNCVDEDPKFMSPANSNYHLDWDSPMRGTGYYDASLPTTDLDGNTRPDPPSIGAYEFERTLEPGGLVISPLAGYPWPGAFFTLTDSDGTSNGSNFADSDFPVQWGDGTSGYLHAVYQNSDDGGSHFNLYDAANPPHSFSQAGEQYFVNLLISSSLVSEYNKYSSQSAVTFADAGGSGSGIPATMTLTSTSNPAYDDVGTTFIVNGPSGVKNGQLVFPSGQVYFYDGTTYIGSATYPYMSNGSPVYGEAGFTWSAFESGSHTITAYFPGDSNFETCSAQITQTYDGIDSSLTLSPQAISPVGYPSAFYAYISPVYTYFPQGDNLDPTGAISLLEGSTDIAAGSLTPYALDESQAVLVGAFTSAGQQTVSFAYPGDGIYAPATTQYQVTVPQDSPTLAVTSSQNPATPGQSVTFTATLSGAYNPGGSVQFSVDNTNYGNPVSVSGTTASFSVSLAAGSHSIGASYSGDSNNQSASGSLKETVGNPTVASLTISPNSVSSGTQSTGTVTLTSPAPSGGAVITLTSSNSHDAVASSGTLTIAAGSSTGKFTIYTSNSGTSAVVVTLTATYNSASGTANITVNPAAAALSSVTIAPPSATSGTSTTGTVTLTKPAPSGGAVVTLTSSNSHDAVAANSTVTVAAGATTASFTIYTSNKGTSSVAVTITGTYQNVSKSATVTVYPIPAGESLKSVAISPSTVTSGTQATGTVTLAVAAPPSGIVVSLSSSKASDAVPSVASVTVPSGATTATFKVYTANKGSSAVTVTITAAYNGVSKTANITVNP